MVPVTAIGPAFVQAGSYMITAPAVSIYESAINEGFVGTVRLSGQVQVYCRSPEQARDIAQHFIEAAGLMEARAREAAGLPSSEELLARPEEQFDPRSELLASIQGFANAPPDTPSSVPRHAPYPAPVSAQMQPFDVAAGIDPLAIPASRIGEPGSTMCWHAGNHPGHLVWDCGKPLPALGDPENRCSAEKDGLICTVGAGHAPVDHVGHGPDGQVIGHWPPSGEAGEPAGTGKPCTCLVDFCEGNGCGACAGLGECYLQQEVTTP